MVVLWFEWLRLVLRPFFLAGGRVYLGMLHPCRVTSNLLGIPWSLLVISGVILWPLLPVDNRPFIGAPTPLVSGRGLLNGSLGWISPYSPYKPWPSTVTERPYFLSITVRNWEVYMRCWICLFDLLWFLFRFIIIWWKFWVQSRNSEVLVAVFISQSADVWKGAVSATFL